MTNESNDNAGRPEGIHPQPDIVSPRRFGTDLGVVPSTCWRWIQRGWLPKPINIGGRLYLTQEQIQEFRARAGRGEFATSLKPPTPVRRVV